MKSNPETTTTYNHRQVLTRDVYAKHETFSAGTCAKEPQRRK